jgi:hypothetical protein
MLQDSSLTSQQSAKTSGDARLELLAAIWARQTGRSIVIAQG